MTASPAPRTPLQLVPEPDDTEWLTAQASAIGDPAAAESESWEATAVLNQWAPEHQLIGAMMWLTADQARPILELVPDTAIWRPTIRWAYQIIRSLVDEGRDPDPGDTVEEPSTAPPLARTAPTSLSPKPGKPNKFSTNGIPNTN